MTGELAYLDSSALVKLLRRERETAALYEWLDEGRDHVSSALASVEVCRAVRRAGLGEAVIVEAQAMMAKVTLVRMDEEVLSLASRLPGRDLRTLDAIHLATAMSLGDLPAAFVTYDRRLGLAAARQGLTVVHPGIEELE